MSMQSPDFPFTTADVCGGAWDRRREEIASTNKQLYRWKGAKFKLMYRAD